MGRESIICLLKFLDVVVVYLNPDIDELLQGIGSLKEHNKLLHGPFTLHNGDPLLQVCYLKDLYYLDFIQSVVEIQQIRG